MITKVEVFLSDGHRTIEEVTNYDPKAMEEILNHREHHIINIGSGLYNKGLIKAVLPYVEQTTV